MTLSSINSFYVFILLRSSLFQGYPLQTLAHSFIIGLRLQGVLVSRNGLIIKPTGFVSMAETGLGVSQIRPELQRPLVGSDGFLIDLFFHVAITEENAGIGVAWLVSHGFF